MKVEIKMIEILCNLNYCDGYTGVNIFQNSSNYTLKICAFYCIQILGSIKD